MKTNVYVDAFNLYYGCLKGSPYRWLDIGKLCQVMLPKNNINKIKYFTAIVSARNDPNEPVRQKTYIRALETIPNLSVIYGQFLSHKITMRLANPPATGSRFVEVMKTEEKGSDVNLATHLLVDGFRNDYEVAVVISNDSDLALPVEVVTKELGLTVGILNPHPKASRTLNGVATFLHTIRKGPLSASQFPTMLTDANGSFNKPATW